jgi:hypothetical protein
LRNLPVDALVLVAIEVAFGHQVGDLVESGIVEQQATKNRLLGLYRVRWHAQRSQGGSICGLRPPSRRTPRPLARGARSEFSEGDESESKDLAMTDQ